MKKYRVQGWLEIPFDVVFEAEGKGLAKAMARLAATDKTRGIRPVGAHAWRITKVS